MAYVAGLESVLRSLQTSDIMKDILATVTGIIDFYLLDKHETIWLVKNAGIPIAKVLGIRIPDWLVYESEGQIGMLLGSLVFKEG